MKYIGLYKGEILAKGECTENNRLFPGDIFYKIDDIIIDIIIVYDYKQENDLLIYFCCNIMDAKIKEIPYLKFQVEWEFYGVSTFYGSPEKYMKNKRCDVGDTYFIMGDILKEGFVSDFLDNLIHGRGCSASCIM